MEDVMTISVYFADGVIDLLKKVRFTDSRPFVQKKAEALILHAHSIPIKEIAKILDSCENTICSYFHEFKTSGIEGLLEKKIIERKSELYNFRKMIEEEFRKNPPQSSKEAGKRIEELTGVKRSNTQIKVFMKSLGMSYRKTAVIPAKANIIEQDIFKKKF
jgi:transposase